MKNLTYFLTALLISTSCSNDDDSGAQSLFQPVIDIIDHNANYSYDYLSAEANGRQLEIEIELLPNWLTHDAERGTISGVADWDNVNRSFSVRMNAKENGKVIETISFSITVNLGEIVCESEFGDPSSSPYILPYETNENIKLWGGYCLPNPAAGHYMWFAYDFETSMGDNIIASRAGEVIATKEINTDEGGDCSGGKENYVFVLHDDGTVMNYVHFQHNSVSVEVGQMVSQGEILGLSGNSGCSSGPHVHTSLFRARGNYDRQYTIPFNYSNADGILNAKNGLITGEFYKAL